MQTRVLWLIYFCTWLSSWISWTLAVAIAQAASPSASPSPSPAPSGTAPSIQSLLKPKIYDRVLKDRDVMTHASLDDVPGPFGSPQNSVTSSGQNSAVKSPAKNAAPPREYSFYAAMLVHASFQQTRDVLTNYELYSKLIPYVTETKYNEKTHILEIQGGILGWVLHSWVRFDERSPSPNYSVIHFQMVAGHFIGMAGDILFESRGEQGTLVYMDGHQIQENWPPKFVMERGAEIVFGFTANRMRSYIESKPAEGQNHGGFPQPRRHL
jgi:hypothetical protein